MSECYFYHTLRTLMQLEFLTSQKKKSFVRWMSRLKKKLNFSRANDNSCDSITINYMSSFVRTKRKQKRGKRQLAQFNHFILHFKVKCYCTIQRLMSTALGAMRLSHGYCVYKKKKKKLFQKASINKMYHVKAFGFPNLFFHELHIFMVWLTAS